MPRDLPPLNALKAFEAAGRLGSFTRAAEELNVSHSAISRHVRGLEKRLNIHLFRVRNTGVELTEQGIGYLAEVTPALDAIAEATERLTIPASGSVTLTTENTIAQKWLIPRLSGLRETHPEIDLKISVDTSVMDIDAHDFDLGLRYLSGEPPADCDFLFPSVVRAYAAPEFAPKKHGKLDIMAFAKKPLIEEATFRLWPEWFAKAGLSPVPDISYPHPLNALLAIESAVAGLGAVLMDEHLAGPELSLGALVEVSPVSFTYGGYFLAVNKRASRRKAVRAVRGWLLEEAAKSVAASG